MTGTPSRRVAPARAAGPVPVLVGEGLAKAFGDVQALAGVDVQLRAGETVALLGQNGAGKTTLIRLLHLLDAADRGRVLLGGRPVGPADLAARRRMALVAQKPHLFRGTVADNVTLPLELRGWSGERVEARVAELLDAMELSRLAGRRARTLSGGEVQRLAFARALAPKPDVLFLDEFTANLDWDQLARLEDALKRFVADGGAALLVTHDPRQVRRLADRAVALRAGRVVEEGPAADVLDRLAGMWRAGPDGRPAGPSAGAHESVGETAQRDAR